MELVFISDKKIGKLKKYQVTAGNVTMTHELETIKSFSARQEKRCLACAEKKCDGCSSWAVCQQIRILVLTGATIERINAA